eukprot:335363_1
MTINNDRKAKFHQAVDSYITSTVYDLNLNEIIPTFQVDNAEITTHSIVGVVTTSDCKIIYIYYMKSTQYFYQKIFDCIDGTVLAFDTIISAHIDEGKQRNSEMYHSVKLTDSQYAFVYPDKDSVGTETCSSCNIYAVIVNYHDPHNQVIGPFQVNTGLGYAAYPFISVDFSSSQFLVSWIPGGHSSWSIRMKLFDFNGNAISPQIAISCANSWCYGRSIADPAIPHLYALGYLEGVHDQTLRTVSITTNGHTTLNTVNLGEGLANDQTNVYMDNINNDILACFVSGHEYYPNFAIYCSVLRWNDSSKILHAKRIKVPENGYMHHLPRIATIINSNMFALSYVRIKDTENNVYLTVCSVNDEEIADSTIYPTGIPTSNPTYYPTLNPTYYPTSNPTYYPTSNPTYYPTLNPTYYPTSNPTYYPTSNPTYYSSYILSDIKSYILSNIKSYILSNIKSYILFNIKSYILSNTKSYILSNIKSYILSNIRSYIYSNTQPYK